MVEPVVLKILQNDASEKLVFELEQLLRRAKTGQFTAFAFTALLGGGDCFHKTYMDGRRLELMGSLSSLIHDLASGMTEGDMPPMPPEEPEKEPA